MQKQLDVMIRISRMQEEDKQSRKTRKEGKLGSSLGSQSQFRVLIISQNHIASESLSLLGPHSSPSMQQGGAGCFRPVCKGGTLAYPSPPTMAHLQRQNGTMRIFISFLIENNGEF